MLAKRRYGAYRRILRCLSGFVTGSFNCAEGAGIKAHSGYLENRHKKAAHQRLFCRRSVYFKPDIFSMAPFRSSSEHVMHVPFGGMALIPVMALARMPSRPPW